MFVFWTGCARDIVSVKCGSRLHEGIDRDERAERSLEAAKGNCGLVALSLHIGNMSRTVDGQTEIELSAGWYKPFVLVPQKSWPGSCWAFSCSRSVLTSVKKHTQLLYSPVLFRRGNFLDGNPCQSCLFGNNKLGRTTVQKVAVSIPEGQRSDTRANQQVTYPAASMHVL